MKMEEQIFEDLDSADKAVLDGPIGSMFWLYLAKAAVKALVMIAHEINELRMDSLRD